MFPDKSLPNWSEEAIQALRTVQNQTPKGCGGCIHSEWIAARDGLLSPGKIQQAITFRLGACRADIRLDTSTNGLCAFAYCTAWNQPKSEVDESTVDQSDSASIGTADHRLVSPLTDRNERSVNARSAVQSPSGHRLFNSI
jgi:hypothetical protein